MLSKPPVVQITVATTLGCVFGALMQVGALEGAYGYSDDGHDKRIDALLGCGRICQRSDAGCLTDGVLAAARRSQAREGPPPGTRCALSRGGGP